MRTRDYCKHLTDSVIKAAVNDDYEKINDLLPNIIKSYENNDPTLINKLVEELSITALVQEANSTCKSDTLEQNYPHIQAGLYENNLVRKEDLISSAMTGKKEFDEAIISQPSMVKTI